MSKGLHDSGPRPSDALVHPADLALATAPDRTMVVELSPAEIIERIRSRPDLQERRLDQEHELTLVYHDGTTYFDPHPDRVVLWRRPDRPRLARGKREQIPYPDMLELRLEPTPRGTQVEMRRLVHPLTTGARRFNETMLAVSVMCIGLMLMFGLGGLLFATAVSSAVVVVQLFGYSRVRRLGHALLPAAYGWLSPYELGPADAEGSAFRVRATSALPAASSSGGSDSPDDR